MYSVFVLEIIINKYNILSAWCRSDVVLLKRIYNEERRRFSLVKNQPRKIVEKVALDIEKLLAKKRKALVVSICFLIEYACLYNKYFCSIYILFLM